MAHRNGVEVRRLSFDADTARLEKPARRRRKSPRSNYCDFNLKNFIHGIPGKPTFEVRVLPGLMNAADIIGAASLFGRLLRDALDAEH